MRRWISFLVGGGWLLLLSVSGCSGKSKPEPTQDELIVWHAYRGAEEQALSNSVTAFTQARPDRRVRLVSIPYDAFANKISVASPRGNGPDLFIYAHDRVGDWASAGIIEPIGFWADEALIDRFFRPTVEALVFDGELYGLPLAFKTLALYYDRTLVQSPPETTDEMIRIARALRAEDPSRWGLAYEYDSLYFHAPWLHGFGGRVYENGGDVIALDEPAAVRSVEFVRRLVAVEKIMPEEVSSALVTSLFRDHKLAFVSSGPWFRGELKGHDDWGVAPLPIISETGQPARPFLGVEGIFLNALGDHKRQAFALMKYLTRDGQALLRFSEGSQLVANRAVYTDPAVANDPYAIAFRAQVERTVPLSNRPHMRRVWTPARRALSQSISRGRPAAEALGEAVRAIRRSGE